MRLAEAVMPQLEATARLTHEDATKAAMEAFLEVSKEQAEAIEAPRALELAVGSQDPQGPEAAHGAEAVTGFADIVEALLRLEALSEEAKSRAEVAIDRMGRAGSETERLEWRRAKAFLRFGEVRRLVAEVVQELNPQMESTFLVRKWKTLLGEYLVSVQDRVKVSLTLAEASKHVRVLIKDRLCFWLSQGLVAFVRKLLLPCVQCILFVLRLLQGRRGGPPGR